MIINIRGTSGSGKSHAVLEYRREFDHWESIYAAGRILELTLPLELQRSDERGRRQPIAYGCRTSKGEPVAIIGHYESPCGGCDNIKTVGRVYELVKHFAVNGAHVVFEGLLISELAPQTIDLYEFCKEHRIELLVIGLNTPIEVCLESVRKRRAARGAVKPLNEKNTRERVKRIERAMERMKDAGVRKLMWASREEVGKILKKELG